jgi:hypothetical protein
MFMRALKYLVFVIFLFQTGISFSYDNFQAGTSYQAGDKVENAGGIYECKPWPYTGWCSIGGTYEPGVGWAWDQAWTKVEDVSSSSDISSDVSSS